MILRFFEAGHVYFQRGRFRGAIVLPFWLLRQGVLGGVWFKYVPRSGVGRVRCLDFRRW